MSVAPVLQVRHLEAAYDDSHVLFEVAHLEDRRDAHVSISSSPR